MIKRLAIHMRNTIDALPREMLPDPMSKFPRGSCGDASLLLGAYFVDCGHLGFEYIVGERGTNVNSTWTSHAWLARGNFTVDITADQFPDAPSKVIVDEPSIWHQQFEIISKTPSDFRLWSGPGTYHLHTLYAKLMARLTQ